MQELKAVDRDLIDRRYRKGVSTRDVAEALKRSPQGTRRSLQRIREALARCVRRKLSREEEQVSRCTTGALRIEQLAAGIAPS